MPFFYLFYKISKKLWYNKLIYIWKEVKTMLTSNQKRQLKGMANRINAVFQVGKDGVNSNMITDILNYLNKNELMKVSILQNCPQTKEEVAHAFEVSGIEVVQIIGKTVVLYKKSENAKNPIILK